MVILFLRKFIFNFKLNLKVLALRSGFDVVFEDNENWKNSTFEFRSIQLVIILQPCNTESHNPVLLPSQFYLANACLEGT